MEGIFESGDDFSGSVKGGEFLDQPSDCWLLKKDPYLLSTLMLVRMYLKISSQEMSALHCVTMENKK